MDYITNKEEKNLEKIVFLQMRNKQFAKFPNREYDDTLKKLSENEETIFNRILCQEIHQIWSYLNCRQINYKGKPVVHTVHEYDKFIKPVSEIILKVSAKYSLTLKDEVSAEFKSTLKLLFGEDYYVRFMKNINQL